MKEELKVRGHNVSTNVAANNSNANDDNKKNNSKRRREICDALAKTAVKRTKKSLIRDKIPYHWLIAHRVTLLSYY